MRSKKLALIIIFFFKLSFDVSAQDMLQDFFRSTGKINTVLAVVIILFAVLLILLLRLDEKLNKLENKINDEE